MVALRLSAQNPVLSVGPTDLIIDDAPRPMGHDGTRRFTAAGRRRSAEMVVPYVIPNTLRIRLRSRIGVRH